MPARIPWHAGRKRTRQTVSTPFLFATTLLLWYQSSAFTPGFQAVNFVSYNRCKLTPSPTLRLFAFDPKEEIWPPTNVDTPIILHDSFIGGVTPKIVAKSPQLPGVRPVWIQALPGIISAYTLPQLQPIDFLLFIFITGYVCIAAQWSKPSEGVPTLPTEPLAGRFPIIERPLGPILSPVYETWLTLGSYLGLVLPFCLLFWSDSSAIVARPLFFFGCQAVTQAAAHRLAIPIRVLVPIVYSVIRLVYLYSWGIAAATNGVFLEQALASVSLLYTFLHLVVVLPVVALRYLRVHFFLVEAAAVELRPGMEASMGFSPTADP